MRRLMVVAIATGTMLMAAGTRRSEAQGIARPLGPSDAEAQILLRKASAAVPKPEEDHWAANTLVDIALAQVEAGDVEGASRSLAKAVVASIAADPRDDKQLVEIARVQIAAGLKVEARAPLRKAFEAVRARPDDPAWKIIGLAMTIHDAQVQAGDDAGRDETVAYAIRVAETKDGLNSLDAASVRIRALAASGREDDAFGEAARLWVGPPPQPQAAATALGRMAHSVSQRDPKVAKPILERVHRSILALELKAEEETLGLQTLALALARAGDARAARRLATDLETGPFGGPAVTLYQIARIQEERGDREGAKATLRAAIEAFDVRFDLPAVGRNRDPEREDGLREGPLPQIAEVQARLGDLAPARALLPRVQRYSRRDLYRTFALVERARGNEAAAKADFALAIAEVRGRLAEHIDPTDPAKLAAEAERFRTEPRSVETLDHHLGALAQDQAASGDLAAARSTVEAITGIDGRRECDEAHALAAFFLATGRAMSGDLAGAVEDGLRQAKPQVRRSALSGAATGYIAWAKARRAR